MIVVYVMCAWFLVLLFSDKDYFLCAIVILFASVLNVLIVDVFGLTKTLSYIGEQRVLISIDGLAGMSLAYVYVKDKLAFKMSLLLAFSVLCHIMILWDLMPYSSFVSNLFYTWYDELIMTVGILQMVISRDGIITALRNIWGHILRASIYSRNYSKSLFARKRNGANQ